MLPSRPPGPPTVRPRSTTRSTTRPLARLALALSAVLVLGPLAVMSGAHAADPAAPTSGVDLGSAEAFSVLGGAGVTSTGPSTVLAEDLGLSPTGTIAGFPPGVVLGATHDKDPAAEAAQEDRQAAYDAAAALPSTAAFAGDQGGQTFKPGVHTTSAAFTNTGTMTLDADGDPGAVFVFQVGAALSSAASSKVVLTDGALATNVYWQVLGAVSMGAGAKTVGTFLAAGAVAFGEGASLKGRILTPGTVTLANTPVTQPKDDLTAPVVTIDAGADRSTNDTTPMISGTTDEPVGRPVSVTIDGPTGQVLSTSVREGGAWAVSATTLAEGPHDVVATVVDASRNAGSATQVLTVDLTAPTVTVTGGALRATNDITPTILGTTDAPEGTQVTVTVDEVALAAVVASDGSWTVDAGPLSETAHSVVASVDDLAGSTGSATQILVVDVTPPVIAIDGGDERWTGDTSPWTYGTTGEQAGSVVHLSVEGQELTAVVRSDGTWSVSATDVPPGVYPVVASITDAAQNTSTAEQTLTVGGPPPASSLEIDGGTTRVTNDATPTISGTTQETSDASVTVSVAGQSLTTEVGPDGSWSVEAATLTEGCHAVTARIETVSGSTGSATQALTVDLTAPVIDLAGGATRSTDDRTPQVSGTTGEQTGTTVHVTVDDRSLTTTVRTGGAWSVTTPTLTVGSHPVTASVTDAAQNTTTARQTLVVTAEPATPPAVYRPDAAIRRTGGAFVGNQTYGTGQQVTQLVRARGTVTYEVRLTNRGDTSEILSAVATRSSSTFTVVYLVGGKSVSRAVVDGTYRTPWLAPGRSVSLVVRVTATGTAKAGESRAFTVRTASTHTTSIRDSVLAVAKVTR
ncbi:ice-binding family protein [Nocardioides plantarum]|uniref:Ice-binding family protein n=1 Tax=Nocardioides plantarum TaxID=29299 RepID=A0ABV5K6L3_9ACTN|nr:ice-binding family protein [Nocardioides plantarum]